MGIHISINYAWVVTLEINGEERVYSGTGYKGSSDGKYPSFSDLEKDAIGSARQLAGAMFAKVVKVTVQEKGDLHIR